MHNINLSIYLLKYIALFFFNIGMTAASVIIYIIIAESYKALKRKYYFKK